MKLQEIILLFLTILLSAILILKLMPAKEVKDAKVPNPILILKPEKKDEKPPFPNPPIDRYPSRVVTLPGIPTYTFKNGEINHSGNLKSRSFECKFLKAFKHKEIEYYFIEIIPKPGVVDLADIFLVKASDVR